jgi:NADH-quinone oxidoreductase subunit J
MQDFFFYFFSFMTLLCGLLVVVNPFSRNPVTSAMFLVLTIIWMAGLFILLHAFFLAAIQILVYAGAVIVLFLFVIMLLDLKEEEQRKFNKPAALLGALAAGLVAVLMIRVLARSPMGAAMEEPEVIGATGPLGKLLFTDFLLPFEMLSVLLLVAMVGVILLSKKDLK